MARLVGTLVALLILAVFIALNLPYRTTVNIFGFTVQDAPSIIVIIASVAAGIVLAIAVSVTSHLAKRRREALRLRVSNAEGKVRELAGEESTPAQTPAAAVAPPEAEPPPQPPPEAAPVPRRQRLRDVFRPKAHP